MWMEGYKSSPPVTLHSLGPWIPHGKYMYDLSQSFEVLADTALRSVGRALERTLTGNSEKRPVHDTIDKRRSLQCYNLTPSDQSLIPLSSTSDVEV